MYRKDKTCPKCKGRGWEKYIIISTPSMDPSWLDKTADCGQAGKYKIKCSLCAGNGSITAPEYMKRKRSERA